MAAPAILTQGTTITITDSDGDPVTILGHQSISGLGSGTATKIDVTTLLSTAKEYRQGLQDWGDMTLNFIWNLDDLGQAEMYAAKGLQSTREMVITLPATDPAVTKNIWTGDVIILQMQVDINADSVAQGTATIAVTGNPVWS